MSRLTACGLIGLLLFVSSARAVEPAQSLFDGKTLKGWKVTEFAGHGEVAVEDGQIVLPMGDSLTGITYTGALPKINYELSLEARRVDGGDFFCGVTFPVGDDPCSFIVGGWGGAVVGLSSLDDQDASENETTSIHGFKTGQWYKIRVRVMNGKIQAWIDDQPVVDVDTKDKKISIRGEVELSKPLGIATWQTSGALRNIKLTQLAVPK